MTGPSVSCKSLEEALDVLRKHELEKRFRYSTIKATKGFGNIAIQKAKKVFWEDKKSIKHGRLSFNGIPFVILGQKDFDCQFGKERKKKALKVTEVSDHNTYTKGKRFLLQPTKKRNCPAKCIIREICTFPTYKVDSEPTKDLKQQINMDILCRCKGGINIPVEKLFIVCLPLVEDHTCDPVGECPTQPIDSRVSDKIKELTSKGVRTVGEVKRHLRNFIHSICQPLPHPSNRRFYPTEKSIQNIMYASRDFKIDQDQQSLQALIIDIQKETIYFYNPVEGGEDSEMAEIKLSMCDFIAKCNQESREEVIKRWRVTSLPHSSQMDSFNCGVYCLIFAEKHLHEDFDGLTRISYEHLEDMRLKVAKKMMLFEVYITDCCPKCGMKVEVQDQKLQCSTCGRCYHFKPYCVEADIQSLGGGDLFCCTLCRFNYWTMPSKEQYSSNNYKWIDKNQALNDLCKSGSIYEEKDVEIIDSEPTTETNKVNKRKRDTEARNKPKRKRTSFFYPPVFKTKKSQEKKINKSQDELYCVCQKPYRDSECMWCCDQCNKWFHPGCIGRDNKETPPRDKTAFLCDSCLKEHLKNWPVDNIQGLTGSPVDEDLEEDDFFIQSEDVQRHMRKAYERCWYIQRLEGTKSSVPWMKRHIMFAKHKGLAHSQGFGEALFSQQAICMIKVNLKKRFLKLKDSRSVYSLHCVIPGMANDTLKTLFEEETGESENYVYKVLTKEAMIAVMQEATGDDYEKIDLELKKTEGKNTSTANALILNYVIKDRTEYKSKQQMKQ